jgi:DNA-3-methyladenine glycosylase II
MKPKYMRKAILIPLTQAVNMTTTRVTRSAKKRALDTLTESEASNVPKPKKKGASTKKAEADPHTPPRKRSKKNVAITQTPTRTLGLNSPTNVQDSSLTLPSITSRPAEPHITNAPLITPGGSRLVAYTKETADISPTKSGIPRATTTTNRILDEACAHLIKMDSRLEPVIKKFHCKVFSAEGLSEDIDPFRSLCSSIIAQQVSGAAASSIKKKFIGLFNDQPLEGKESDWGFPTPEAVSKSEISDLRSAGLSQRKAEYVKGLAEKFASGELSAKALIEASNEEVLEKLTAVRGLGQWSVEMFACFCLKRLDVFSTGDLGIQ